MTTAHVVYKLVTNNSLPKDYSHPDDHKKTNNWKKKTQQKQELWKCKLDLNL